MKPLEVMKIMNRIEDDYPVTDWIMGGICIWPIVRIQIAYQLLDKDLEPPIKHIFFRKLVDSTNKVLDIANSIVAQLLAQMFDHQSNAVPDRHSEVVLLGHTTCRSIVLDNKKYDIFLDPLAALFKELEMSCFMFECAPGNEYRIPRYSKSMFIQLQLNFIKLRAFLWPCKYAFEHEESYHEFVSSFNAEEFAVNVPDIKNLQKQVTFIIVLSDYFRTKMDKIKPMAGFVVCYYTGIGMAFNLACHKLGIPAVDVQHGVAGHNHPAYGRWNKVPVEGYQLLPSIFWCWGEEEAKAITDWNGAVSEWHTSVVGGNLGVNMFKEDENSLVKDFDKQVLELKRKNRSSIYILLTLQNGYGFPEMYLQAMAASPESWYWWVRLHPDMMAERGKIKMLLKQINNKNINLDDASDLPLYSLLRHSDIHVTGHSATVMEAETFGVPSVICNETGVELFADQIVAGTAVSAFTSDDILNAIIVQTERKSLMRRSCQPVYNAVDLKKLLEGNRTKSNRHAGQGV